MGWDGPIACLLYAPPVTQYEQVTNTSAARLSLSASRIEVAERDNNASTYT
jgi:hypothetical protein